MKPIVSPPHNLKMSRSCSLTFVQVTSFPRPIPHEPHQHVALKTTLARGEKGLELKAAISTAGLLKDRKKDDVV